MKAINITQEVLSKNPHLGSLGIKVFTDSNFPSRFNGVENVGGYYATKTNLHEQDGFWDVEKLPLGENQKYGSITRKGTQNLYHYPIIDLTDEEIQSRIISNSEAIKEQRIKEITEAKIIEEAQLIEDDDEALENQSLFPFWDENNTEVFEGYKYQRIVGLEIHLYKVKVGKGHFTQANWTPENTPSLFTRVGFTENEAVPWNSADASAGEYTLGYLVTHNGQTWISTFDGANAWEPGVFGWDVYTG